MKKMNPRTLPDEPVTSSTFLATDVESVDLSTTSIAIANEPQDATSAMVGEIIDVNILEGNYSISKCKLKIILFPKVTSLNC
jgi:hypothetical protein